MTCAVETDGLIKIFRNRWTGKEVRAVDGISLNVEHGSTFGLLGPNGAGKTTFVKLLLSCAHPTAGRAMIFGRDSRESEARRLEQSLNDRAPPPRCSSRPRSRPRR